MSAPALTQYVQGVTTPSADNLNSMMQTCDTFADLRGLVGVPGMMVVSRGAFSIGDGLGGSFYWSAAGTGPDDGINQIAPFGASVGVWIRLPSGLIRSFVSQNLVQEIPNDVPTAIAMDTVQDDPAGMYTGIGGFIIPSSISGRLITLRGQVLWDSNATGNRYVKIQRNLTDYIGMTFDKSLPVVGSQSIQPLTVSATIQANTGDVYQMVVTQTSGGMLGASPFPGYTWMELDVVG